MFALTFRFCQWGGFFQCLLANFVCTELVWPNTKVPVSDIFIFLYKCKHLTFAICEVANAEYIVGIWVMVLFDVGCFLRSVLQLHGHFFQLFVKLFKKKCRKTCTYHVVSSEK